MRSAGCVSVWAGDGRAKNLYLASLLKGSFAVLRADQASDHGAGGVSDGYDAQAPTGSGIDRADGQRLLDEALQTALDNFQAGETSDMLYISSSTPACA